MDRKEMNLLSIGTLPSIWCWRAEDIPCCEQKSRQHPRDCPQNLNLCSGCSNHALYHASGWLWNCSVAKK